MEGAVPPEEWYIARFCRRFRCLPEDVLRQDPSLLVRVDTLLTYVDSYETIQAADKQNVDPPEVPFLGEIRRNEFAAVREKRGRLTGGREDAPAREDSQG